MPSLSLFSPLWGEMPKAEGGSPMPDHTPDTPDTADVAVIGAGILGLSTAMALATRHDGLRVVALEQESGVGRHQSGNNSGVIHSGLYYRPGSAKARMAVAGAERMYAFCDEHGIGAERCGKVVVATHESELERMRELHRRGDANGVPDIRELGPDELREFEPNAAGVAALHIPSTGIADYRGVCEKYRELLESAGGSVRLRSRVSGVRVDPDGVQLATTTGVVRARTPSTAPDSRPTASPAAPAHPKPATCASSPSAASTTTSCPPPAACSGTSSIPSPTRPSPSSASTSPDAWTAPSRPDPTPSSPSSARATAGATSPSATPPSPSPGPASSASPKTTGRPASEKSGAAPTSPPSSTPSSASCPTSNPTN